MNLQNIISGPPSFLVPFPRDKTSQQASYRLLLEIMVKGLTLTLTLIMGKGFLILNILVKGFYSAVTHQLAKLLVGVVICWRKRRAGVRGRKFYG